MGRTLKVATIAGATLFALLTAAVLAVVVAYAYVAPQLPSIDRLKDVQLQEPMRVYAADGRLITEYGEVRRSPVAFDAVPEVMIQAFLAAEDDRFFSHPGVDYQGLARAALNLLRTGERTQGGSTITMQVARNFFLTRERTYTRKLSEIFLALKIEHQLSKEEIMELYLNKIFLGHRSYGVAAAARVYYGKTVDELTVAETAMIAALPKAPSTSNPVANPSRALARRNYVLGRMYQLGYIDRDTYQEAVTSADGARVHGLKAQVDAPHAAEMVRQWMLERYGEAAYDQGYRVYTTIEPERQAAANAALRESLTTYDRRRGYRGADRYVDLDGGPDAWDALLAEMPVVRALRPGLVTAVEERSAEVYVGGGERIELGWDGLSWARVHRGHNRYPGPAPEKASDVVREGDVIRVSERDGQWALTQVPEVNGALVALSPEDGAVRSLVGGYDYRLSSFNRVVQAQRQPGSAFKPFLYSAGLEHGFTAATLINDAPVVFDDAALEDTWRPQNYTGRFYGPTRMREALVHSRNLASIRLLRNVGIQNAINHLQQFGFRRDQLPRNLSLALGSGDVTPLELARAYAVFANGGYRVEPYLIQRVEGRDSGVLYAANPPRVCPGCDGASGSSQGLDEPRLVPVRLAERVISAQNAFVIHTMLKDVIQRGTGRAAQGLGRNDLAGKTGTTNDQNDAWFAGYHPELVATAWVGYDQLQPLGPGETGARTALPMWTRYMDLAVQGLPEGGMDQPSGLVTVRIDPATGMATSADNQDAVFEIFPAEYAPRVAADRRSSEGRRDTQRDGSGGSRLSEELF